MAKKGEDRGALLLLSMVGIVAVVGIIILVMGSGVQTAYLSDDLAGQASKASWKANDETSEQAFKARTDRRTRDFSRGCDPPCPEGFICSNSECVEIYKDTDREFMLKLMREKMARELQEIDKEIEKESSREGWCDCEKDEVCSNGVCVKPTSGWEENP